MRIFTGDQIQLRSWCSVAGVTLGAIITFTQGEQSGVLSIADHTPSSNRSLVSSTSSTITLTPYGDIEYAGVRVTSTTTVPRGRCYIQLVLLRGGRPVILACGYVSSSVDVVAPKSEGPLEGLGFLQKVTVVPPAAGAEFSTAVPSGARWRVVSLNLPLVCGIGVANRYVAFTLDDSANALYKSLVGPVQVATETKNYYLIAGYAPLEIAFDITNYIRHIAPGDLVLSAGYRIRTSTSNLAVADQYGTAYLFVEEWIEPA